MLGFQQRELSRKVRRLQYSLLQNSFAPGCPNRGHTWEQWTGVDPGNNDGVSAWCSTATQRTTLNKGYMTAKDPSMHETEVGGTARFLQVRQKALAQPTMADPKLNGEGKDPSGKDPLAPRHQNSRREGGGTNATQIKGFWAPSLLKSRFLYSQLGMTETMKRPIFGRRTQAC
jgi:hypothetical protein